MCFSAVWKFFFPGPDRLTATEPHEQPLVSESPTRPYALPLTQHPLVQDNEYLDTRETRFLQDDPRYLADLAFASMYSPALALASMYPEILQLQTTTSNATRPFKLADSSFSSQAWEALARPSETPRPGRLANPAVTRIKDQYIAFDDDASSISTGSYYRSFHRKKLATEARREEATIARYLAGTPGQSRSKRSRFAQRLEEEVHEAEQGFDDDFVE